MRRRAVIVAGLVLILFVVNWQIVRKERVLHAGTPILLELVPVDPRSLIEGDYMRLDYAIARQIEWRADWPATGQVVVTTDADGIARLARRHEAGISLAAGEHLLLYRRRGGRIRIGTDAFYFQEGHANRYAGARYGELRVDDRGESLLIGLRDAQRRPLGANLPPSTP